MAKTEKNDTQIQEEKSLEEVFADWTFWLRSWRTGRLLWRTLFYFTDREWNF